MPSAYPHRRTLFRTLGAAGAGAVLAACTKASEHEAKAPGKEGGEEDVSPVEDLMREHGALRRVLLIYRELVRRLERREAFAPDVLISTTGIVRRFVEDYHEKLEEDFVFPRFEKARKQVDLVTVLCHQHQAGRRVTDTIREHSTPAGLASATEPLVTAINAFIHMYEPHAAREDTVLFPELRALVGEKEYDALGDAFEDKEHALFGPKGFEGIVAEVAQLERALGIYDLAKFTPS